MIRPQLHPPKCSGGVKERDENICSNCHGDCKKAGGGGPRGGGEGREGEVGVGGEREGEGEGLSFLLYFTGPCYREQVPGDDEAGADAGHPVLSLTCANRAPGNTSISSAAAAASLHSSRRSSLVPGASASSYRSVARGAQVIGEAQLVSGQCPARLLTMSASWLCLRQTSPANGLGHSDQPTTDSLGAAQVHLQTLGCLHAWPRSPQFLGWHSGQGTGSLQ